MQLESHATPPQETPQQRYASLHRAIERGLDSDELWKELAEVSLGIGHEDEAVRCSRRIRNDTTRLALESRLARLGLASAPSQPGGEHAAAPAASDAGDRDELRAQPGLGAHVLDAFQFLVHQHMPWLVLATTLSFPLLFGVGGFLTTGDSPLLLAALAAVPGLCMLALVGAMHRQILAASAESSGDVPPIPGFGVLVDDARRFFVDGVLVVGSLVGPSLVGVWLGAPWSTTAPGLVIGAFFAPMAWALRHLRGDLTALSPVHLLRGVARTGTSYLGLTAVVLALALPATAVALCIFDRPVWIQIAMLGPLVVLPSFVAARLLGTWIDAHRSALGMTASPASAPAPAPAASQPTPSQPTPAAPAPRTPRRPEALESFRAPSVKTTTNAASPTRTRATAPAKPVAKRILAAAASSPAPAAPARAPARAPAPAAPAATAAGPLDPKATKAPRAIEGRKPSRLTDAPDLSHMPGATVVSGTERQLHGAASRRT